LLHYDLLFIKALAGVFNGESSQSLKDYKTAYNLLYKNQDPEIQAKILKDKGFFYLRYGITEEKQNSIEALQKSLAIYEKLDNPAKHALDKSRILSHTAQNFLTAGQFDSCMIYLQKAIDNNIRYVKNPYFAAWCDLEMADALISIKKDDVLAIQYLQKTFATLEQYKLTNTIYYLETNILFGDVLFRKGNLAAAAVYYKKSLEKASLVRFRQAEIENLLKLSQVYQQLGDTKQALMYYQKYHDFTIELALIRSQRSLKEHELQLDLVGKEKEIESGKLTRNFTFIGIGLLALLLLAIYYNYRNQKKLNAILNIRNEEKEFLIKEIHHRVKNNLQILSSLLHLQSRNIKDDAALGAVREGQNRVKAMSLIHQKLYMGDNLAAVEMKDYMQNLADNLLDTFGIYDDRIKIVCDVPSLSLDVDTAIPLGLVANELITNSLKYGFPKNFGFGTWDVGSASPKSDIKNPKYTEGGLK
jgi:two-component system, sensor histidine kinase PdtaS